jgi:hypothetical protein
MSVAHLQGKRTGRRRGSRSRPPWLLAVRWAQRQIERPGGRPPSKLALLLYQQGLEHPDRLLLCIARADDYERQMEEAAKRAAVAKAAAAERATTKPVAGKSASGPAVMPQNVRRRELPWRDILGWLSSRGVSLGCDDLLRCKADADGCIHFTFKMETTETMDRWTLQHLIATDRRTPADARVVKCELDRRGMVMLTLQSDQFTYVNPWGPIPEL